MCCMTDVDNLMSLHFKKKKEKNDILKIFMILEPLLDLVWCVVKLAHHRKKMSPNLDSYSC